jgi:hypothetical protein
VVVYPPPAVGGAWLSATPLSIQDAPRFPHRGLLVDTSRHWLPVEALLGVIDGLARDRANVLHWHATDAQSFPLVLQSAPQLAMGACVAAQQAGRAGDANQRAVPFRVQAPGAWTRCTRRLTWPAWLRMGRRAAWQWCLR